MGEMTIRLDEPTLIELSVLAARRGLSAEALAADLLRRGLQGPAHDRAATARAIQAAQRTPSTTDSVDTIREDRNRE